ncbi:hypothetical protein [Limnoglobus roseus]|uniref:Tetratricopeptide repeat protein n=1 Tax=Limnoglobus roseus TaxID=2598579 RepID=A0A5C1A844_9BACT|nr:hypothetical protein [Limnoglobus roseus]QEL13304.1 hypothetical protein PX52LOC_00158 [Limnoglobus roseus]
MRKLAIRSAATGTILATLMGLSIAADPPAVLPPPKPLDEPRKLRTELEALAAERDAMAKDLAEPPGTASERAKLRAQLLELVKRVGEKKMAPAAPPMPPPTRVGKEPPVAPPPVPKFTPDDSTKPVDAVRAGQNYFRSGDVDAALRTFKLIDTNALPKEDRAFVQYMTACCLRKTNKLSEAAAIFREVADHKDDEFLAEYAVWQLSTMKSIQELETNLEQLRSRRKSK